MAVAFMNPAFCGSPDQRLLFILVCVPRVLQKSASTNLLRGLYRLQGKQWSVIQRTGKYVTVTLDTNIGTYECTLYTNLPLEGKAGSFNAT